MTDLDAIRARAKQYELGAFERESDFEFWGEKAAADILALLAEVERLRSAKMCWMCGQAKVDDLVEEANVHA